MDLNVEEGVQVLEDSTNETPDADISNENHSIQLRGSSVDLIPSERNEPPPPPPLLSDGSVSIDLNSIAETRSPIIDQARSKHGLESTILDLVDGLPLSAGKSKSLSTLPSIEEGNEDDAEHAFLHQHTLPSTSSSLSSLSTPVNMCCGNTIVHGVSSKPTLTSITEESRGNADDTLEQVDEENYTTDAEKVETSVDASHEIPSSDSVSNNTNNTITELDATKLLIESDKGHGDAQRENNATEISTELYDKQAVFPGGEGCLELEDKGKLDFDIPPPTDIIVNVVVKEIVDSVQSHLDTAQGERVGVDEAVSKSGEDSTGDGEQTVLVEQVVCDSVETNIGDTVVKGEDIANEERQNDTEELPDDPNPEIDEIKPTNEHLGGEDGVKTTNFNKAKGSGSDSKLVDPTSSSCDVSTARESHSEHTVSSSANNEKQDKDGNDKESQKQRDKDKDRDRDGNKRKRERGAEEGSASDEVKECLKNAVGDVRDKISTNKTMTQGPYICEIRGSEPKTTCRLQVQISDAERESQQVENEIQRLIQHISDTSQQGQNSTQDPDSISESSKPNKRRHRKNKGKRRKSQTGQSSKTDESSCHSNTPLLHDAEIDNADDHDSSNCIDSFPSASQSDIPITPEASDSNVPIEISKTSLKPDHKQNPSAIQPPNSSTEYEIREKSNHLVEEEEKDIKTEEARPQQSDVNIDHSTENDSVLITAMSNFEFVSSNDQGMEIFATAEDASFGSEGSTKNEMSFANGVVQDLDESKPNNIKNVTPDEKEQGCAGDTDQMHPADKEHDSLVTPEEKEPLINLEEVCVDNNDCKPDIHEIVTSDNMDNMSTSGAVLQVDLKTKSSQKPGEETEKAAYIKEEEENVYKVEEQTVCTDGEENIDIENEENINREGEYDKEIMCGDGEENVYKEGEDNKYREDAESLSKEDEELVCGDSADKLCKENDETVYNEEEVSTSGEDKGMVCEEPAWCDHEENVIKGDKGKTYGDDKNLVCEESDENICQENVRPKQHVDENIEEGEDSQEIMNDNTECLMPELCENITEPSEHQICSGTQKEKHFEETNEPPEYDDQEELLETQQIEKVGIQIDANETTDKELEQEKTETNAETGEAELNNPGFTENTTEPLKCGYQDLVWGTQQTDKVQISADEIKAPIEANELQKLVLTEDTNEPSAYNYQEEFSETQQIDVDEPCPNERLNIKVEEETEGINAIKEDTEWQKPDLNDDIKEQLEYHEEEELLEPHQTENCVEICADETKDTNFENEKSETSFLDENNGLPNAGLSDEIRDQADCDDQEQFQEIKQNKELSETQQESHLDERHEQNITHDNVMLDEKAPIEIIQGEEMEMPALIHKAVEAQEEEEENKVVEGDTCDAKDTSQNDENGEQLQKENLEINERISLPPGGDSVYKWSEEQQMHKTGGECIDFKRKCSLVEVGPGGENKDVNGNKESDEEGTTEGGATGGGEEETNADGNHSSQLDQNVATKESETDKSKEASTSEGIEHLNAIIHEDIRKPMVIPEIVITEVEIEEEMDQNDIDETHKHDDMQSQDNDSFENYIKDLVSKQDPVKEECEEQNQIIDIENKYISNLDDESLELGEDNVTVLEHKLEHIHDKGVIDEQDNELEGTSQPQYDLNNEQKSTESSLISECVENVSFQFQHQRHDYTEEFNSYRPRAFDQDICPVHSENSKDNSEISKDEEHEGHTPGGVITCEDNVTPDAVTKQEDLQSVLSQNNYEAVDAISKPSVNDLPCEDEREREKEQANAILSKSGCGECVTDPIQQALQSQSVCPKETEAPEVSETLAYCPADFIATNSLREVQDFHDKEESFFSETKEGDKDDDFINTDNHVKEESFSDTKEKNEVDDIINKDHHETEENLSETRNRDDVDEKINTDYKDEESISETREEQEHGGMINRECCDEEESYSETKEEDGLDDLRNYSKSNERRDVLSGEKEDKFPQEENMIEPNESPEAFEEKHLIPNVIILNDKPVEECYHTSDNVAELSSYLSETEDIITTANYEQDGKDKETNSTNLDMQINSQLDHLEDTNLQPRIQTGDETVHNHLVHIEKTMDVSLLAKSVCEDVITDNEEESHEPFEVETHSDDALRKHVECTEDMGPQDVQWESVEKAEDTTVEVETYSDVAPRKSMGDNEQKDIHDAQWESVDKFEDTVVEELIGQSAVTYKVENHSPDNTDDKGSRGVNWDSIENIEDPVVSESMEQRAINHEVEDHSPLDIDDKGSRDAQWESVASAEEVVVDESEDQSTDDKRFQNVQWESVQSLEDTMVTGSAEPSAVDYEMENPTLEERNTADDDEAVEENADAFKLVDNEHVSNNLVDLNTPVDICEENKQDDLPVMENSDDILELINEALSEHTTPEDTCEDSEEFFFVEQQEEKFHDISEEKDVALNEENQRYEKEMVMPDVKDKKGQSSLAGSAHDSHENEPVLSPPEPAPEYSNAGMDHLAVNGHEASDLCQHAEPKVSVTKVKVETTEKPAHPMTKAKPLWRKVVSRLQHPKSYRRFSTKHRKRSSDYGSTSGTQEPDMEEQRRVNDQEDTLNDDGWKTLERNSSPLASLKRKFYPMKPSTNKTQWRRFRRLKRLRNGAEMVSEKPQPVRRQIGVRNFQRMCTGPHTSYENIENELVPALSERRSKGKTRKRRSDLLLHGHLKEAESSGQQKSYTKTDDVFEVFCDTDKKEVSDLADSMVNKETPTVRLLMKPLMSGMNAQTAQQTLQKEREASPDFQEASQLIDETTRSKSRPSKRISCSLM